MLELVTLIVLFRLPVRVQPLESGKLFLLHFDDKEFKVVLSDFFSALDAK